MSLGSPALYTLGVGPCVGGWCPCGEMLRRVRTRTPCWMCRYVCPSSGPIDATLKLEYGQPKRGGDIRTMNHDRDDAIISGFALNSLLAFLSHLYTARVPYPELSHSFTLQLRGRCQNHLLAGGPCFIPVIPPILYRLQLECKWPTYWHRNFVHDLPVTGS